MYMLSKIPSIGGPARIFLWLTPLLPSWQPYPCLLFSRQVSIFIRTFIYPPPSALTFNSRLVSQLPPLLRAVHFEITLEEEHIDQGRKDQQKLLQEKVPWVVMITISVSAGGAWANGGGGGVGEAGGGAGQVRPVGERAWDQVGGVEAQGGAAGELCERDAGLEHSVIAAALFIFSLQLPGPDDLAQVSKAVARWTKSNVSFARTLKLNQNLSLKKFRIQFAYRLDPVDLAWGYIMGVQTEVDLKDWLWGEKNFALKARLSVDQMVAIGRGRWEGRTPLRAGLARCCKYFFITGWLLQGVCPCLWVGGGGLVSAEEGGGRQHWQWDSPQAGESCWYAANCQC